jgi:penicillin-binding protein 1A
LADPKPQKPKVPLRVPKIRGLRKWFLDLDARLGHFFFSTSVSLRASWDNFSAFMDRFHVAGAKRLVVEATSEGMTLGTAGLVLMLALAVPAFRETGAEDWLKKTDLSVTFLDRYGVKIGERGTRINDTIPLEELPDNLIKATLATEDRRFYEHFGIDFAGTFRAVGANARAGGVVQGGSSITQQLAKNLFLSNERTIERKINEAFLALWLEARLTKKQILKLYLDRAYLGGGSYGVDAAAQYYFNKSARDVNLAEAAMLAGLFKAPTRYAPHVNLAAARARANVVLDNLVDSGMMTEGQVFGARRNPAKPIDRRDEETPNYYLDWAYKEVQQIVDKLPKSVTERVFIVRTGLDVNIQRAAEAAIEDGLRQFGRDYNASQAAMVIMEPNGIVRAMVGGRDYGESQFNRATDAQRQPGSAFKPFVYTTALLNGYKTTSIVLDGPLCLGNWCPQNYGHSYGGPMTLLTALTHSVNTVAVRLADAVGRDKIVALARKLGVTSEIKITRPLPLGAVDLNVLEMTRAYAHFANGGFSVNSHAVIEMHTPRGESVWRYDVDGPKPKRVLPPHVIEGINTMLNSVTENGTGRRALISGIKIAGKTGTTNAYRDAWFMGFTGNFVGGIWMGNDDYTPTRRMTGGSLPAMTWQKVMAYAHQGVEIKPIPGLKGSPAPALDDARVAANLSFMQTPRPVTLSQRTSEQLLRLEKVLREANTSSQSSGIFESQGTAVAIGR